MCSHAVDTNQSRPPKTLTRGSRRLTPFASMREAGRVWF